MTIDRFAYVGSFTTARRRASGHGLTSWRIPGNGEEWEPIGQIDDLVNPSFLAVARGGTLFYVAHGDETYISVFDVSTRVPQCIEKFDTGGLNGVKICFDRRERYLLLANYHSGDVTVFALAADGRIEGVVSRVAFAGSPSAHGRAGRQDGPHPHDAVLDPSGKFLIVPDLGLDRVVALQFDDDRGLLQQADGHNAASRAGAGPRHAAFHPSGNWLWVANELDSTVSTYSCTPNGSIRQKDVISSLPGAYTGQSTTAEILFHEKSGRVYVSNRGHDSVTIFDVDAASGVLRPRHWAPCQGGGPRFMCWSTDASRLFVANEETGDIQRFTVDVASGLISHDATVARTPSPSAIVFLPERS